METSLLYIFTQSANYFLYSFLLPLFSMRPFPAYSNPDMRIQEIFLLLIPCYLFHSLKNDSYKLLYLTKHSPTNIIPFVLLILIITLDIFSRNKIFWLNSSSLMSPFSFRDASFSICAKTSSYECFMPFFSYPRNLFSIFFSLNKFISSWHFSACL